MTETAGSPFSLSFSDLPAKTATGTGDPPPLFLGAPWLPPLEAAAAAIARLDTALDAHPLASAWLYRARLEAGRREAAVDGHLIDPWHLAALVEGVRFRMTGQTALDRGMVFLAARHALDLYRWRVRPGEARQEEIARAAAYLEEAAAPHSPLVGAAVGFFSWLAQGGARAPMRAAFSDYWVKRGLSRLSLPFSGAAALSPEAPRAGAAWTGEFLRALGAEAKDGLHLLRTLERDWQRGRLAVQDRRRGSYATAAVDTLAAAPLLSATTLAASLGIAPKNAGRLLESFTILGIAVEVTHRSKRRLYGLKSLAPFRETTAPTQVPSAIRRGRARHGANGISDTGIAPEMPAERAPSPPLPRAALDEFEFAELDGWMSAADEAIRRAQVAVDRLSRAVRDRDTVSKAI